MLADTMVILATPVLLTLVLFATKQPREQTPVES